MNSCNRISEIPSSLNPSNTPCTFGKRCKRFPNCGRYHAPGTIPDCPYMNTPEGCTDLNCHFSHPKGFVHACIFGARCRKRATCPFTHPDQRGVVPSRETPPPPTHSCVAQSDDQQVPSSLNPSNTPCTFGKCCKRFPNCGHYHTPDTIPDCRYGVRCNKGISCLYNHPDQRGLVPSREAPPPPTCPVQRGLVPSREAPPPPTCSRNKRSSVQHQDFIYKRDNGLLIISLSNLSDEDFVDIEEEGIMYRIYVPTEDKVCRYIFDNQYVDIYQWTIEETEDGRCLIFDMNREICAVDFTPIYGVEGVEGVKYEPDRYEKKYEADKDFEEYEEFLSDINYGLGIRT